MKLFYLILTKFLNLAINEFQKNSKKILILIKRVFGWNDSNPGSVT